MQHRLEHPQGGPRGRRRRQPRCARRVRRRPQAGPGRPTRRRRPAPTSLREPPPTTRRSSSRPLGLQIPAMKRLSEGVKGYGASKGYEVIVQDPKLDPQKQVTDLQTVIETGAVAGAWAICDRPARDDRALVQIGARQGRAADPQRHPGGLRPRRPRARRLVLDHRLRGPGHRPPARSSATASTSATTARPRCSSPSPPPAPPARRTLEGAVKAALAATAPDAEIVTTITVSDRTAAQTDVGTALQGNPDVTAVYRPERRGRARHHRRLQGRRQGPPLHHRGRRQRRGPRRGRGRRHLRRPSPCSSRPTWRSRSTP